MRISSIAPIALNWVAPYVRAQSRKRLAENRGTSTSPHPIVSEPIVEYASALTWNSGNEVIMRSSRSSSSQYGKPSPAIAYVRWVCMTSLDRPVVPEVGSRTATSPSATSAGPRASAEGAAPGSAHPAVRSSTCRTRVVGGSTSPCVPSSSVSVTRACGST